MINIKHFEEKLIEEKSRLEAELSKVGRINPSNPADWEPTAADLNVLKSDKNEASDRMSDFENRSAIEVELENRHENIVKALARIKDEAYGKCKIDGGEIEEKRLEANPAAETCMTHLND